MSKSVILFCVAVNILYASCRPQSQQQPSKLQVVQPLQLDPNVNPYQNLFIIPSQLGQIGGNIPNQQQHVPQLHAIQQVVPQAPPPLMQLPMPINVDSNGNPSKMFINIPYLYQLLQSLLGQGINQPPVISVAPVGVGAPEQNNPIVVSESKPESSTLLPIPVLASDAQGMADHGFVHDPTGQPPVISVVPVGVGAPEQNNPIVASESKPESSTLLPIPVLSSDAQGIANHEFVHHPPGQPPVISVVPVGVGAPEQNSPIVVSESKPESSTLLPIPDLSSYAQGMADHGFVHHPTGQNLVLGLVPIDAGISAQTDSVIVPEPQPESSTVPVPDSSSVPQGNLGNRFLYQSPEAQYISYQPKNAHYYFYSVIDDNINGNYQERVEKRDGLKTIGSYAYDDGYVTRSVNYQADETGYHILKETTGPSLKRKSALNGVVRVMTNINGKLTQYSYTKTGMIRPAQATVPINQQFSVQ